MLVQVRLDGEASGLDAERRAQALRADEDLPKARLKRVSSRPCWGLLLSSRVRALCGGVLRPLPG